MSTTSLNSILNSANKSKTLPRVPYAVSCSLCGCNGASVRCIKCNSMAFCIGCDDMYHRHPKRRSHLRQAVALEFIQAAENSQKQNSVNNGDTTNILYPWRIRTQPRILENWAPHPSKMPIPPPRRKKKTLSFSGIKDTFRKLVHHEKPVPPAPIHPIQPRKPEPIYATINPQTKSSFRPLPPPPPPKPDEKLYANINRIQETKSGRSKSLSGDTGNGNGEPPLPGRNFPFESSNNKTSSTLPRKNFSYHDLYQDEDEFMVMLEQPPVHHGSTQSMYPGLGTQQQQPMFYQGGTGYPCHCGVHCPKCHHEYRRDLCHHGHHHNHHHCDPTKSLTNSLEELGSGTTTTNNHRQRCNGCGGGGGSANDYDDELTDDECDDDLVGDGGGLGSLSRAAKNRIRRAKMKRSLSTHTMYGRPGGEEIPDTNAPTAVVALPARTAISRSSPTTSMKSLRITEPSGPGKYPSDISDSSSSLSGYSRKGILSKSPKTKFGESKINSFSKSFDESDMEHEEKVNAIGQWSCRFCTFLNDPETNICEICSKTRLKKESKPEIKPISTPNVSRKTSFDSPVITKPLEKPISAKPDPNDVVFDEKFIQEQLEIEKEMRRRKENELRIAEENRQLENKENSNIPEQTSSKPTVENPEKLSEEPPAPKMEPLEQKKDPEQPKPPVETTTTTVDHEKIVARMIEEKISEQFGKLNLVPPAAVMEPKHAPESVVKVPEPTPEPVPPIQPVSQPQPEPPPPMYQQPFPQQQQQPPPQMYQQQWNQPGASRKSSLTASNSSINTLTGGYSNQPPGYFQPPDVRQRMSSMSSFDDLQSMSSVTSAPFYYQPEPVNYPQPKPMAMNSGRQMIQILREAEKKGYTADDLEVAIQFSPHGPLDWLEEHWKNLLEMVITMANNQILELERAAGNTRINFSAITDKEAKIALRQCKGNVWQSVEKCVQRHQDEKLFGRPNFSSQKKSSNPPGNVKSFSFHVAGMGSGKANNDGNENFPGTDEEDSELISRSKLPMEEFLSAQSGNQQSIDYYMDKIKSAENLGKLNEKELETLILNWQYEKAVIDYQREQMKLTEKEKRNMQMIIDVQKRIGGYLSDGTTTEEELDREVAQVFRQKGMNLGLSPSDSEQTPVFTTEDLGSSQQDLGLQISGDDDEQVIFEKIKQRIEAKLTELKSKSAEALPIPEQRTADSTPVNRSSGSYGTPRSKLSVSSESNSEHSSSHPSTSKTDQEQVVKTKKEKPKKSEPIETKIVLDRNNNNVFITESSVPIEMAKKYPEAEILVPVPKPPPEFVEIKADMVIIHNESSVISSQNTATLIAKPMFSGNLVSKKPQSTSGTEEPPIGLKIKKKKSTVIKQISAETDEIVENPQGFRRTTAEGDRNPARLSCSNKSLSMMELAPETNGSNELAWQKPVFSRLKGYDKMNRAQLLIRSEQNLSKLKIEQTPRRSVSFRETVSLPKSKSTNSLRNEARKTILEKLSSLESLNHYSRWSLEPTTSISVEKLPLVPSSNQQAVAKNEYSYDFEWARTEMECELCTQVIPVQDIVVMITCTHYACRECMKKYLTVQIRERQRLVIRCPFCDEPDIGADEDEKVFDYLGLFDPFVRHIIDPDVYELFQRKVRDRALMRDPNFMWCIQCTSGFMVPNPRALTVICPDCRCIFCRNCKKPWKTQHFNMSCEEYAEWEKTNDLEYAEQQLNKHLKEFGIQCPNCNFRYQLAKGGCMHFRCIQCSYDFCGGCYRPFKMGSRCFRAKVCERLGLHAHHPRHCLFYLRDKDIKDLQRLLDQNQISYRTTVENVNNNKNDGTDEKINKPITRCQVMEQKEIDFVMKDKPCNRFVELAGLCKLHYKEYLGDLIYKNNVDPISIFDEGELELTLKRENIRIPSKIRGEDYRSKLVELILEKIPLNSK